MTQRPYVVITTFPGKAVVLDRKTGESIGRVEHWESQRCWAAVCPRPKHRVHEQDTRRAAASALWEHYSTDHG